MLRRTGWLDAERYTPVERGVYPVEFAPLSGSGEGRRDFGEWTGKKWRCVGLNGEWFPPVLVHWYPARVVLGDWRHIAREVA